MTYLNEYLVTVTLIPDILSSLIKMNEPWPIYRF